uniref:Alpha-2,3/8-sialyltransferase n=1 Tax=Siphoviridae sp. ctgn638 TaxID=2827913 RepID=A0A8S5TM87_9CAUD|nr:MAG TPA: alpha-2,3/8-sialyltransferase [Siphoviridae sp. ctgn638]
MFQWHNTIILFGRSMYINQIRDYIPSLINRYHTIGCNQFVNIFPNVENVIFYDDIPRLKVSEKNRIIADIRLIYNKKSRAYGWLNSHKNKELYLCRNNKFIFENGDNKLNLFFHTPSMALNWCYKKGYKNVILAGIDLTSDTRHFDSSNNACWTEPKLLEARKHLEKVCTRYLNIYQLNPDSDLDLPKISIKDLLNV